MTHETLLTPADLERLEIEISNEIDALPTPPTMEDLRRSGYRESERLNQALDMIASFGRVATLLIAESIQSGAAIIIAVVFAMLEWWRVYHGAAALGQQADQAALIAFAVVTANIVHPIYALRGLRGQNSLRVIRQTGRGYASAFFRRMIGKPVEMEVDTFHNPTLHLAAAVITWSTVVLAVYDILGPLLTQIFTGNITRPLPIMVMELLMGLGLSLAGVFFLQSAAHEIGVRILTDQPARLVDVLEQKQAERAQQEAEIRERVRARFVAGKIADQERRAARRKKKEQDAVAVTPLAPSAFSLPVSTSAPNGNGRGPGYHADPN